MSFPFYSLVTTTNNTLTLTLPELTSILPSTFETTLTTISEKTTQYVPSFLHPFLPFVNFIHLLEFLSTSHSVSLPLSTFKTCIRLVVIISTYLLFRPHLEKLFRTMTGRDAQDREEIKERMEVLKGQSAAGVGAGGNSKKVYAVSTPAAKGQASGVGSAGSSGVKGRKKA